MKVASLLSHAAILDTMPAHCTLRNNEPSEEELKEMMEVRAGSVM